MRSIRQLVLCVLLAACAHAFALDNLNMHVRTQRFLDSEKNTIIHVDYQIPYNNLVFLAHKGGYFAEVDVVVEVVEQDSVVFSQAIRDNIGISNKDDARSAKTYLNRASFNLSGKAYEFRFRATDLNSQRIFAWSFPAEPLPPESLLSDLELCSAVRPDSSSYLGKFHRGNTLYKTQPSLIFDKTESDFVNLFFEVYTREAQRNESSLLVLTVEQDSVIVSDDYLDFNPDGDIDRITLKIPLSELKPGKYSGSLMLQLGEQSAERDFDFFVTEPKQENYSIFPNPDDDFQLLRYFIAGGLTTDWKNYDEPTKRRYVSQTWKYWAQSNNMNTQMMLDRISERVDYANRFFGHFEPGWTTDRGRIHIRNGKPDEITSDTSSDETRFVRKDYQIWKYSSGINAVYLFVDLQLNGNYKLLYVSNDDRENTNPDYLRYLGEDFDTSLLDN